MQDPFQNVEVWFLTGSQDLYGADVLAQVAAQSQEVAGLLDAAEQVPVRVVWKPVLKDSESIRRMMLEAAADDRCVGLIAWMHTFSPAKMWIGGLRILAKPIAHLHTQYNRDLPWNSIDMDFMNLNQSAHGDREFGHLAARIGLKRKVVVGHWENKAVQERLGAWSRAAAARSCRMARWSMPTAR